MDFVSLSGFSYTYGKSVSGSIKYLILESSTNDSIVYVTFTKITLHDDEDDDDDDTINIIRAKRRSLFFGQ